MWKNHTGFAERDGRKIKFGLPGSSDIIGIHHDGRFIAIEVKTGTGRLSEQQKNFRNMICRFHGVYVEARCVEDVQKALAVAPAQAR